MPFFFPVTECSQTRNRVNCAFLEIRCLTFNCCFHEFTFCLFIDCNQVLRTNSIDPPAAAVSGEWVTLRQLRKTTSELLVFLCVSVRKNRFVGQRLYNQQNVRLWRIVVKYQCSCEYMSIGNQKGCVGAFSCFSLFYDRVFLFVCVWSEIYS